MGKARGGTNERRNVIDVPNRVDAQALIGLQIRLFEQVVCVNRNLVSQKYPLLA